MPKTIRSLAVALAATVLFALSSRAEPAEPATTTITVPDLDCPNFAKKVASKLGEIAGVAKVDSSVEAKTFTVTPKSGTAPSPKAMWEAVEKGGFDPSKLVGPGGTFTSKPKS